MVEVFDSVLQHLSEKEVEQYRDKNAALFHTVEDVEFCQCRTPCHSSSA
jgi:hypothetical protein